MSTIQLSLPGGSPQSFPKGISAKEALEKLAKPVRSDVFAIKVNGIEKDLMGPVDTDGILEPLTFETSEGKEVYRHSSTHIMAQAVKECFPTAQLTIGPAIDEGFFYDFAFERPFTPEDLEKIEAKALEIIQRNLSVSRRELSKEEAIEFFKHRGESYKVELIQGFPEGEPISVYAQGDFVDLCRGPHVPSTGYVKAFKLLNSAGAYWRGDERNPMLQRIYGTSFPSEKELNAHLHKLEEIKRRDHRKLGKELDLFSIQDETGPGLILWHPKGSLIRLVIENFWREQHVAHGYELVYSPHVARLDLWKTSGHVEFYKENMFTPMPVEASEYQLKPMNCPFHIMIYKSHLRSYRDLPLRFGELGTVYRYERSGVLHGLMRVRGFTQDDAHLFCAPEQLAGEVRKVLKFVTFILETFGFTEFHMFLSTRPEKAVGSVEQWDQATQALESALKEGGYPYQEDPGEGVFYGPKIDVKIKDALGRSWQCSTVQIDFNNPQRFGLTYIGEDGKTHQPIMIHRALLGSIERFFGILVENYAGAFPMWLAPVQAKVLPISDKHHDYATQIEKSLRQRGIRVERDLRNEKIGLKIREAEKAKIPIMVVVGDREAETKTVSVRQRNGKNLGTKTVTELMKLILDEIPETVKKEAVFFE
ncbi:MAG: threonine--tRNA ligase [Nitrospira sp.]|nr:threonine--tRNA ligase [Nitrospira sp.]MCA9475208.1 threonine--tRNA ligase [Nitrospira sp.]MCA9478984.1 threonine--tRNA ligase [Nitrospira sp.]MCB9711504.1 threonine--tRNA ligase [Nitrospiraceae bacterium]MDR4487383.1 threonine--tRNA ligase [Nitrospirales bacterium]